MEWNKGSIFWVGNSSMIQRAVSLSIRILFGPRDPPTFLVRIFILAPHLRYSALLDAHIYIHRQSDKFYLRGEISIAG